MPTFFFRGLEVRHDPDKKHQDDILKFLKAPRIKRIRGAPKPDPKIRILIKHKTTFGVFDKIYRWSTNIGILNKY